MSAVEMPATAPARTRTAPAARPAPAGGPPASRTSWALPLGACLLLALALRLPFAHAALGNDEGGVAWVAQQWGAHGHGWLYGGAWLDRPPLLIAAYKLAAFGGAPGVRVLGAVAALALVGACFTLARISFGARAGLIAALLSALLGGSPAILSMFTPAELLAAVPATLSMAALVGAHRSGRWPLLVAAGTLAVIALLVKQSFLDAACAGAVYLVSGLRRPLRGGLAAIAAYAAGALLPVFGVALWLALAHLRAATLLDALFGFRVHALDVLQASNISLLTRVTNLAAPAVGSGLIVAIPLAALGVWRYAPDRRIAAALLAWLVGGLAGTLGGGSYWAHYLIQVVPAAAVGTAAVLDRTSWRRARLVLAGLTLVAVLAAVAGGAWLVAKDPRRTDGEVAAYVRAHARDGDTSYVLYARANLNFAIGLRTPFPYSWSLMMRARPDARARLLALMRSPRRPTWVVRWQSPAHWQLDPEGALTAILQADYRTVARFGACRVLLRSDRSRP